jgi:PleD family two-component response regulator
MCPSLAIIFTNHNNHSTAKIMDRIIQKLEQSKISHKQSAHEVVKISAEDSHQRKKQLLLIK